MYLRLCREFGGWPEDYKNKPADEIEYWAALLNVEGEVEKDWAGGAVDDVVYFDD